MTTSVIHIRTHQRVPTENDVYIGRAGHGEDGYFGNPIRIGARCHRCGKRHEIGAETLGCYRDYFTERVFADPEFRRRIAQLRGKRLVCFCKPKPCHGDVIVEWLASGQ